MFLLKNTFIETKKNKIYNTILPTKQLQTEMIKEPDSIPGVNAFKII